MRLPVTGAGLAGMGGAGAPRRAARGGFALPDAAAAEDAAPAAALPPAGLALPAAAPEPPEARARRRARAALAELRGLQLDLLRGAADPRRLARLESLTAADPAGLPPPLAEALAELRLRLRVELARLRAAAAARGAFTPAGADPPGGS